jgi:hypothetical protein
MKTDSDILDMLRIALVMKGTPIRVAAGELHLALPTAYAIANRKGWPRNPPLTGGVISQIQHALQSGATISQVSQMFRQSPVHIKLIHKELGGKRGKK